MTNTKRQDKIEILRMLKDLARAIEVIAETNPSPGRASISVALCEKTKKKVLKLYKELEKE